eukprot:g1131.t1
MTWVFCRCLLRTSTWVLPDRWPHPRRADPFAGVPSIPNDPNDEPADRREDTNRLPSVGDTVRLSSGAMAYVAALGDLCYAGVLVNPSDVVQEGDGYEILPKAIMPRIRLPREAEQPDTGPNKTRVRSGGGHGGEILGPMFH